MMNEKEMLERENVVEIAKTYLKTPYHHQGRIRGVGIDCGMLLLNVFEEAGLVPHLELGVDIPRYPPDWALHRDDPRYLSWVEKFAVEVNRDPLPGDIVLHQYGRVVSHGGIVVKWPLIIHSYRDIGVIYANAEKDFFDKKGKTRQRAIFSFWG